MARDLDHSATAPGPISFDPVPRQAKNHSPRPATRSREKQSRISASVFTGHGASTTRAAIAGVFPI